jgi:hypothetical protein
MDKLRIPDPTVLPLRKRDTIFPIPSTALEAVLCAYCHNQIAEGLLFVDAIKNHHSNVASFKSSVDDDCYICNVIWRRLSKDQHEYVSKHAETSPFSRVYHQPFIPSRTVNEYTLRFEVLENAPTGVQSFHIFKLIPFRGIIRASDNEHCQESILTKLTAVDWEDDSADEDCPQLLLPESTSSTQSLELAMHWYQQCSQSHTACQFYRPPKYRGPTRLVHVENDLQSWRLVENADGTPRNIRYSAVSHCWGDTVMFKLTEENRNELLQTWTRISRLPKTFQDAIKVTVSLGFSHLWIDSLCIIQNSKEDWQSEASRMGDVYSYAEFTIAAASARNGSEGCFRSRSQPSIAPRTLGIPEGERLETQEYMLVDQGYLREQVGASPLYQRAWVVQERFLSRRILNFAHDQIFWECSTREACETYPASIPTALYDTYSYIFQKGLGRIRLLFSLDRQEMLEASHKHRKFLYSNWHELINIYMNCGLTNEEDKLIAISAVAKLFGIALKDVYLAGIWQNDLHVGLLWRLKKATGESKKLSCYRAPSWSWAAFEQPIHDYWFLTEKEDGPVNTEFDSHCIQFKSACVDTVTDDRWGQINNATLVVEGKIFTVPLPYKGCFDTQALLEVSNGLLGVFHDRVTVEPKDTLTLLPVVYAYECTTISEDKKHCLAGLILKPTEKKDEYTRLGSFQATSSGLCRMFDIVIEDEQKAGYYQSANPSTLITLV